ncbi:MAG: hypothetical protein ACE5G7_03350, partial [Candidatus Hydrothermarchaeaceae archaeon]
DEKRYEILGSVILEDEIGEIKETWKRKEVIKLMTKASSERVEIVSESKQREIMKSIGLQDQDAFHLMAALEGNAECFITVDDYILRRGNKIEKKYGIKVRNPVEFLMERE